MNGMVLNSDKSEVIIIGAGSRMRSLDAIDKISVAGASMQPAACLKSLGVLVNSTLSTDKHVNPFADQPITVFVHYAMFV